jgi:hypothetical protein
MQSGLKSDRTGDDTPRHSQESEVNCQYRTQEDITRHIRLSLPRKSRCFCCFLSHFGRKLYYTFKVSPWCRLFEQAAKQCYYCTCCLLYMARYLMILRRANPLLGALEGVGPGNLDFFRPKWPSRVTVCVGHQGGLGIGAVSRMVSSGHGGECV